MTVLRVVFDTNVFQKDSFELLEQSPFRQLVEEGLVNVIYSHIFQEEIFKAYRIDAKRDDLLNKWIPYVLNTSDRLCNDFVHIWEDELINNRKHQTPIYMPPKDYGALRRNVRALPPDGSWHGFERARQDLDENDRKRKAQNREWRAIRQAVKDWRRAPENAANKHARSELVDIMKTEFIPFGRSFIKHHFKHRSPIGLAARWARSPSAYPYFSQFVRNMVYMGYYAAMRDNDKIDLNAQADLDLMTHLLHADVLVSNETKFMRLAFRDLWESKGKLFFNTEQFVQHVASIR
ncbi:hypothetical protein ACO0LO_01970 [Undibacterium sp. TJN25]|uniref:hypothetical protein n=1 Tax=Undibacterium sp. TJN25 TaxID=3413056 RepID=UPI003BF22BC2